MNNTITNSKFFEGGNATFTVHNDKGQHFTYKIRKPSEDKPYFVSLLTGPDNLSSYTYLGMYYPNSHKVHLTRKSRFSETSTCVKVLRWAISRVVNGQGLPQGYGIHHEGKCAKCGRRLTTPESIQSGIGPKCSLML